ncbi:MAG TPA: ATP-binding protein, partial [Verrucomicrobiae bacterium]|nr:ATP-binding protein [Verrucomicrobiae bacterium]
PETAFSIHLEGTVLWANSREGQFVLQDGSDTEELQMNLGPTTLHPGERIRLDGDATITMRMAGFQIGAMGPVVDDDGIHTMTEKSGSIYLHAGQHAICLDWFNGPEKYGLTVEYQGPGLPRQKVPDAVLFRFQTNSGSIQQCVPGLDYACYPATGEVLPDFNRSIAVRTGTVSNFDLSVITQPEHIALEFTGCLDVARDGLYTFYLNSDDGSRLFVDERPPAIRVMGVTNLPRPAGMVIGRVLGQFAGSHASTRPNHNYQRVEVQGEVTFASQERFGWELELTSETGRLRLELADGSGLAATNFLNSKVDVVGICQSAYDIDGGTAAGVLLVSDARAIKILKQQGPGIRGAASAPGPLPILSTAAQVHQLSREEAQRGYPVHLEGVVTCVLPERQAFTVQDETRGIYVVDASTSRSVTPAIGEYLEIEGKTDPSLFAPIIDADQVKDLGEGSMPQPIQPTWDRLMNGSLDAQYVELQGVITTVQTNIVTLFTGDGRLRVELEMAGIKQPDLERYEDAVIRIRGCLFASWDYVTHLVKVGDVRLYGAQISVDQPAPRDMFSLPLKTVSDLLEFNPRASVFERVKVSGVVIYAQPPQYYLMDRAKGLQFVLKKSSAALREGDEVEVVGFPGLNGQSPLLQEAVARKIGAAPLPSPKKLDGATLVRGEYDSTRVKVDGLLDAVTETPMGEALEMSSSGHTFIALLNSKDDPVGLLRPGSRLELAGVYVGEGGNRALGQDITSFQLLLASAADVKILASPPWWTLKRLLVITGGLACVLAAAFLWITQLHRQVEQRSAELAVQIRQRETVEHQRAMEQERTRIAQDLHDELGSGITEISMLASRARFGGVPDEKRHQYLELVREKARELVTVLDEIVWAMNPRHDSLASLVSYLSIYADHFLGLANIAWHLENASGTANPLVQSRCRHQLFLAFKEALTNVVRHAGASEVLLYIHAQNGELSLNVSDNGRGVSSVAPNEAMDGISNMRARIEKLGGRFEISGDPGRGTTVRFSVPLNT